MNSVPFDKSTFDLWFDAQESSGRSILDKPADIFDSMPSWIRSLKNFDPSGFFGYVADVMADNKADRKEKRFRELLYYLYLAICELKHKVDGQEIDIDHIRQQFPILFEVYFDLGMQEYQLEKIKYFKNILVNGIIDYDRELDEKIYIFSLLASLTIGQMRVFILVNGNYRIMKVEEIAHELGLENAYARQICMSLNGMGLLNVTDIGGFNQGSGGYKFGPTEYGKLFVAYVAGS